MEQSDICRQISDTRQVEIVGVPPTVTRTVVLGDSERLANAYQRRTRGPSNAPTPTQDRIDKPYQTATNGSESSGQ